MNRKMDLNEWIEQMKAFCVFIGAYVASIVTPIQDALFILGLVVTYNIWEGIKADRRVHKKPFSIKKAWEAIQQMLFFWTLIFIIHTTGSKLNDPTLSETGVKWVTYIACYFYLVNILKNAKLIHPQSKAIAFMYDILTIEIFAKLQDMIGLKFIRKYKEKDEEKQDEENTNDNDNPQK